MASNFTISVHRNSDQLDLRLMGDFDGTSACELLNALEKNGDSVGNMGVGDKAFCAGFDLKWAATTSQKEQMEVFNKLKYK